MKFSQYDRPYEEFATWRRLCPPDEWRRVSPSALSGILPDDLLHSANTVLVLSSDAGESVTYVTDIFRIDAPASAIDQEPYVITFNHAASSAAGHFVHHGNWRGRSIYPGPSFFDAVAASGIEQHYPYDFIPDGSAGHMSQIRAHPQAEAFWQEMKAVRRRRA